MSENLKSRPAIIVMGVSGSGKSSIGESLAEKLGLPFEEGDALHSAANIEKMSHGIPLTDKDRMPWLDLIGKRIVAAMERGEGIIVSCSALKRIYRDRLRAAAGGKLYFVYLDGSQELLAARMGRRKGHFMPASLLESQFATLEVPTGEPGVVTVGIEDSAGEVAAAAFSKLSAIL